MTNIFYLFAVLHAFLIVFMIYAANDTCKRKQRVSKFGTVLQIFLFTNQLLFYAEDVFYVANVTSKCMFANRIIGGLKDYFIFSVAMFMCYQYHKAIQQVHVFITSQKLPSDRTNKFNRLCLQILIVISIIVLFGYMTCATLFTQKALYSDLELLHQVFLIIVGISSIMVIISFTRSLCILCKNIKIKHGNDGHLSQKVIASNVIMYVTLLSIQVLSFVSLT